MLINNIVSFEQLGPDFILISTDFIIPVYKATKLVNQVIYRSMLYQKNNGLDSWRVKIGPTNESCVTPAVSHIFRML